MKNNISIIVKYLFYEIVIKYLFCYIIVTIGILFIDKINNEYLSNIIINIISSLILLPIVFIIYDLYKKALAYKSATLVNESLKKDISEVFIKFTYFTRMFYENIENLEPSPDKLNEILNYSQKDIFEAISTNVHMGYFIFSIFDNFDTYIESILDSTIVMSYINVKELALLKKFINDYNNFKLSFSWISTEEFIKYKDDSTLCIMKSKFTKSTDPNEEFFDISISENGKSRTIYSAKYNLFDEEPLKGGYKLSGTKAKEISDNLYSLYSTINKWKKLKGIPALQYDRGLVSVGRLYLGDNITYNEHMYNNISIRGNF